MLGHGSQSPEKVGLPEALPHLVYASGCSACIHVMCATYMPSTCDSQKRAPDPRSWS